MFIVEIVESSGGSGCLWMFFIFLFLMEIMGKQPKLFAIILAILLVCAIIRDIIKDRMDIEPHPIRITINTIILVILILGLYVSRVSVDKMQNVYNKDFSMSNTEITQGLYESVMGKNPSWYKNRKNPVENISWYDAVYFCNKFSETKGKTPVYEVNGSTDVSKWDYIPHTGMKLGKVTWNKNADGFRLPTEKEWEVAARAREPNGYTFTYAGSNKVTEVGWYKGNSGDETHPVAKKNANGTGLYDMTGNVCEWCWDTDSNNINNRYIRGGSYNSDTGHFMSNIDECEISYRKTCNAADRYIDLGFRIVGPISD